jgi:hypothetical protein
MFTIFARAAALENPLPAEICWMPLGEHNLNAGIAGGGSFKGKILCDRAAAETIAASFVELRASGQRMVLDLDHSDSAAAAEVTGFFWDPSKGIMARVSWLPIGEDALRNRAYTSFSPAFLADQFTGKIGGLIPGRSLGGLTNFPAFQRSMPAIAARMGDPSECLDGPSEIAQQFARNRIDTWSMRGDGSFTTHHE